MPDIPQRHLSPLRYPGGKGKVANFIKLLFINNNLIGCPYAEIYAGGASVALSLLYEEYASHIYINDLNRSVHAFWHAVLNDTDALCKLIMDTAITIEEWQRQKSVQLDYNATPIDLAYSTFFLNRTNRSGIIGGGVIGGKMQTGEWKIDARFNKPELVQRIKKIARHRNRITLTQLDAVEFIQTILPIISVQALVYLDPPYYVKGRGLYEHFYEHANHADIARLVRTINQQYLVSYDAAPEILRLYDGHERLEYGLNYSAADRYEGAEVMFFSEGLDYPEVDSPANINIRIVHEAQTGELQFA